LITYKLLTDAELFLYDTSSTNPKYAGYLPLGTFNYNVDLSTCPREFLGTTIVLTSSRALVAGEIITITIFGWEEETI